MAFDFASKPGRPRVIGLLDLASGGLSRIPSLDNRSMVQPCFARSGESLCVSIERGSGAPASLATIDLQNFRTRLFAQVNGYAVESPIYSRDGRSLIYTICEPFYKPTYICSVEIASGKMSTMLPPQEGFYLIIGLQNGRQDTVLFQGIGPASSPLQSSIKNLGLSPITNSIFYRLKPGFPPEMIFPELNKRTVISPKTPGDAYTSLSSSANENLVVTVGVSDDQPYQPNGAFNDEIFSIVYDGVAVELTHLRSHLGAVNVSNDGRYAVFLSDPDRAYRFDACLLEISTGRITELHLLDRLSGSPLFL